MQLNLPVATDEIQGGELLASRKGVQCIITTWQGVHILPCYTIQLTVVHTEVYCSLPLCVCTNTIEDAHGLLEGLMMSRFCMCCRSAHTCSHCLACIHQGTWWISWVYIV